MTSPESAGPRQRATQGGQGPAALPEREFPPSPPGYPIQLFPADPSGQPEFDERPDEGLPRRIVAFTRSQAGLVVGMLGVAVGTAFTYLFSVLPGHGGGAAVLFDPGRTLVLFANLGRPSSFPLWQGPLVVLAPFLPLIQLLVVPLLCLSAARPVGPRLVTRARLVWLLFFLVLTAEGVAATLLANPGEPLLLLHWLGSALVVLALALPHERG